MYREQHNTNYHLSTISYDEMQYAYDVLLLLFSAFYKGLNNYPYDFFCKTCCFRRSSWITYSDSSVTQHIQSLPFGESFISQRIHWATRYTFSAKEKDENTGYHYFGARYYDSETSVWLSVDPMADKYPHLSPYMYAEGNPVMMVDPNGMATIARRDEWELDQKGNVVNRIENKEHDSFHIVEKDDEGNYKRIASSKEYEYETVEVQRNPKDYKDRKLTLFEIEGDDKAKEIFEFFGDNYTEEKDRLVEWIHAKIGRKKSDRNIVGTTHKENYTSLKFPTYQKSCNQGDRPQYFPQANYINSF